MYRRKEKEEEEDTKSSVEKAAPPRRLVEHEIDRMKRSKYHVAKLPNRVSANYG
jgi:hypothetical protein